MTDKKSPEAVVKTFIDNPAPKSSHCATCAMPNVGDVDRAILAFNEAKNTGKTTQDWASFHKHVLVAVYKHKHTAAAMRRHSVNCLDLS